MHPSSNSERRKTQRRPVFVEGTITFAGRYRLKCLVQNLSEGCAKLAFNTVTNVLAKFALNIVLGGRTAQYLASTIWRNRRSVGVEFVRPPMMNAVSILGRNANLVA